MDGDVSLRIVGLSVGTRGPDPLLTPVRGGYSPGTLGALLGRLAAGPVVVEAPMTRDGKLRVVKGDSYMAADGRPIDVPRVPGDTWPADLTGWELSFDAGGVEAASVSAPVPAGAGQMVRIELASDVTARLTTGDRWAVEARRDGRRVTLRRGPVEALVSP